MHGRERGGLDFLGDWLQPTTAKALAHLRGGREEEGTLVGRGELADQRETCVGCEESPSREADGTLLRR